MNNLKQKYGSWALITGASSGIGEEFAIQLAQLGFNLILIARRKERLMELSNRLIEKNDIEIKVLALDLNDPNFMAAIEKETHNDDIGLLINNAGFTITGDFLGRNISSHISLLNVNCLAPLLLSHFFGNKMKAKGRGGIINISSASAFLPVPKWSVYSASKAFILHFTEALWYELKTSGVDVLAVCPGPTKTEFAEKANVQSSGLSTKEVVKSSLKNLSKKPSVIVGTVYRISTFIMRIFGRKTLVFLGSKVVQVK